MATEFGCAGLVTTRSKATSGQVNLTLEMCGNLPVPVPSDDEQARVCKVLKGAENEVALEEATLDKLRKLKSGVMTVLLTGRVRVPERK